MSEAAAERPQWAIVIHGGAKTIEPEKQEANRRGCAAAVQAGQTVLARGGSALEAIEAAIRTLEDDPTFNAGYGADLDAEGRATMDAALMEGSELKIGSVANIQGVKHPVSVARLLVEEQAILLVGDDARRFAEERGAEICPPEGLITPERRKEWEEQQGGSKDTVGAVALDATGMIAAGTSTGGLLGTLPGRVGDSPMPGCGFYADNQAGGVSFSGDGENIARVLSASRVMQSLEAGQGAEAAARAFLPHLERVGGEAGAIVIDAEGRIGMAHNSPHFAVAWMTDGMNEPQVALSQNEKD